MDYNSLSSAEAGAAGGLLIKEEQHHHHDYVPHHSPLLDYLDTMKVDLDFEPCPRARSNTWPIQPPPQLHGSHAGAGAAGEQQGSDEGQLGASQLTSSGGGALNHNIMLDGIGLYGKKSTSRRNAWGNMSYADLITQAISSSSDKRLTLSQIYDWMVGNVPYFKDKGDSNSSAGWKVRHCFWLFFCGAGDELPVGSECVVQGKSMSYVIVYLHCKPMFILSYAERQSQFFSSLMIQISGGLDIES